MPPVAPTQAPVVNNSSNNSVINEEKPREPEISVIKLFTHFICSMNPSSFVCNKSPVDHSAGVWVGRVKKSSQAHYAVFLGIQQGNPTRKYQATIERNHHRYREERSN